MDLTNSELYIALSSAVGTDTNTVIEELSKQLQEFNYDTDVIKISRQILQPLVLDWDELSDIQKPNALMDKGNDLRRDSNNDAILACSVSELIHRERPNGEMFQRRAFIISSLKHPSEVDKFREIYSGGFFLIAINENEAHRIKNLNSKNLGNNDAEKLIQRDSGEKESFGQHTRDVFEIADFHITLNCKEEILKLQIGRILDLIFGNPFITPTFDEYAMFMAYSSGLRSADLSRQVGAVIANKNNEIVATGANDVPKFGGGQYWPDPDNFKDHPYGRDYLLGYDSNKREHQKIIKEIVDLFDFSGRDDEKNRLTQLLATSSIRFLTEYNRAVHAEMSAIVLCARIGISLQDATLYCTTFPCHNCAKHIIGTGIERVVYIEPYPKSKTMELYSDSASISGEHNKVHFEEFVGIGPRRFFDLFSLKLSSGRCIIRKDSSGKVCNWQRCDARLRCQLTGLSYLEKEGVESVKWNDYNDNKLKKGV